MKPLAKMAKTPYIWVFRHRWRLGFRWRWCRIWSISGEGSCHQTFWLKGTRIQAREEVPWKKCNFMFKAILKELRKGHIIKCIINILIKEHGDLGPTCLSKHSRKEGTHYIKRRKEWEYFWRQQSSLCQTKARRDEVSKYLGLHSKNRG